jgi:MoaA/NifB/PqqE/SkfB family radical SAM enzyme
VGCAWWPGGWQPAAPPSNVYLTQRCNLRCVYCSAPFRGTGELDTATWRVFDELADLGCLRMAILGGEPLLRADVGDLIAHTPARHERRPDLERAAGAAAARQVARPLAPRPQPRCARAVNDAVRGAGVFAAVQAALAAARSIGIPVKLNAVMSSETAPHLDALLAFCEREDLSLTINVVRSEAPDLWRDAASVRPEDATLSALLTRLAAEARRNPRLLFSPSSTATPPAGAATARIAPSAATGRRTIRVRDAPACHHRRNTIAIDADGGCIRARRHSAAFTAATPRAKASRRPGSVCTTILRDVSRRHGRAERHPLAAAGSALHFARRHLGRFA